MGGTVMLMRCSTIFLFPVQACDLRPGKAVQHYCTWTATATALRCTALALHLPEHYSSTHPRFGHYSLIQSSVTLNPALTPVQTPKPASSSSSCCCCPSNAPVQSILLPIFRPTYCRPIPCVLRLCALHSIHSLRSLALPALSALPCCCSLSPSRAQRDPSCAARSP
jgi:hypothetical protein